MTEKVYGDKRKNIHRSAGTLSGAGRRRSGIRTIRRTGLVFAVTAGLVIFGVPVMKEESGTAEAEEVLMDADDEMAVEDAGDDEASGVSQSFEESVSGDLSGLIEVVGEKDSSKGESLSAIEAEEEQPTITVPTVPLSDTLELNVPEAYESPEKAMLEYLGEYELADYKYASDTLFVTCTQKETENGGLYYLTHVIIADADQIDGVLAHDELRRREEPLEAAQRTGAKVLINGSYFNYGTCLANGGTLLIQDGQVLSGTEADSYEICLREDGALFSPGHNTVDSVLRQGVKFSWGTCEDLLIRDGQMLELLDLDWDAAAYPRSAVGMVCPGNYYLITAGEAHYERGITIYEEQEIFHSLGCWYARGLDGGGSAALVIDGEYVNDNGDAQEDGTVLRRSTVDFVAFYE